jgi:asparagine synthase (glutamine-hydrolysing)
MVFSGDQPVKRELIQSMMNIMRHRGPDDEGAYVRKSIGLGHKRLSIIDLSRGKQPICNEDESVWIVFNGEIYNYQEIRKNLLAKGHVFRTDTDTEVIVHAYEEYGKECLGHLRGMFAFAIWDERAKSLFLARDRVGIKPLYYCMTKDFIVFASELKAILLDPEVPVEVDHSILDRCLTYLYTPGAETLIRNVVKLPPGHYVYIQDGHPGVQEYWDLQFHDSGDTRSFQDAKSELIELLKESVRLHMISDVPVGFLLSGGVDSTALLSLSIEESNKDLSSFTIGFEGESFEDERVYARMAANRYGIKHHETTMSSADFLAFLPDYVWHMEEPVCEPPAVALYYVSRLAKEHVKVLISGEGGDEAFAGYQNYRNLIWLERIKKYLGPLNQPAAKVLEWAGRQSKSRVINKYAPLLSVPLEHYYYGRTSSPFSYFNKEAEQFYTKEFYAEIDKEYSLKPTTDAFHQSRHNGTLSKMLYVDTKGWLADDLLIKADKITMANSVELRVPLLDHKVLEYAAGLSPRHKIRGITTKHILKEALRERIPREIINRKKTGFPLPYERWLQTDLKTHVKDILLDRSSVARGYFNEQQIENVLLRNVDQYAPEVFTLVILELWHRAFMDGTLRNRQRI